MDPGICPECGSQYPIVPKDRRARGAVIGIAIGLLPLLAGALFPQLAFITNVVLCRVLKDVGNGRLWDWTVTVTQATYFVGVPVAVIFIGRAFVRRWRRRNGPSSLGRLIAVVAILSWLAGGFGLAVSLAMMYYTRP
jgi:hypothetical protein